MGCPSEDECPAPTGSEYYYVSFVLDGPAIEPENVFLIYGGADKGFSGPEITVYKDYNVMLIGAFNCPYAGGGISKFSFGCELAFDTRGNYIGTYSDQGITVGNFYFGNILQIKEGGELYNYNLVDGSLTITSFGDVGGDAEGTFNLTLEAILKSAPSYGIDLTAIGDFRLIRLADSNRPTAP